MNKEHFLIELKLHLRQLSLTDQQAILQKYEDLFAEKLANGLNEYQITKELASPKEIAISILKEFNLELEAPNTHGNDWLEFSAQEDSLKESEHPYFANQQTRSSHDSGFIRFFQITGIIFLNLFFMLWLIFGWGLVLFIGWVLTVCFIGSPFMGIYSILTAMNVFGFFQLSVSIVMLGVGLIGSLIMLPFTKISFNLLKSYLKWNLQVLKGERAL
ncbi:MULTISPECIES: DUF1700 domain-containing protein [Vagococcus]|uniref:DUF1700 domain-containing protein n=1 Tax=Vagococcus fluvialis bH819 TaxID=1255619 RepID=A0A1X6WNV3_9ENTE|nr:MULTISPECIES: DUF1700 domain-containing protein [Vagococcus]SLM86013.1 hypothetical protein FM121_07995 [Vagococcus fluvialis bH819]HCM88856.1 DUF1700 domain-containing protein [Vagococcus sp.]